MAVSFVAKGTTFASASGGQIVAPAGNVGDLLIMYCETEGSTDTVTTPTGWTQKATVTEDTTTHTRLTVLYRKATGGADDSPTVADPGDHLIAWIERYRGQKAGDPFEGSTTSVDATSDGSASVTGGTSTTANTMIVAAYTTNRNATGSANFSAQTNANLGSITERGDDSNTVGAGGGIGSFSATYVGPGSWGSTAVTYSVSSRKAMWCAAIAPNTAPTIAQNTADASTFTTATPQILFTGSDTDADDLTYNLQLDTTPVDSYNEENFDGWFALTANGGSSMKIGQSFHGVNGTLSWAAFYAYKTGTPPGNVVAKLYTHTGTFGSSSAPGTVLATSDPVSASSFGISEGWVYFFFSTSYTMSVGTDYIIDLEYTSGDISNYVSVGTDTVSSTHAGNRCDDGFGGFLARTGDTLFKVWLQSTLTTFNVLSAGGSGWVNIPHSGDTDPFAAGDQIGYTPSTLINNNYQWRVRVNDGGIWSAWSTYRTFIVLVSASTGNFLAFMGV